METFSWARNCGREVHSQRVPRAAEGAPARLGSPRGPPGAGASGWSVPAGPPPTAAAARTRGPARTLRRPFAARPVGDGAAPARPPGPGLTFSFAASPLSPGSGAQPAASGSSPPVCLRRGPGAPAACTAARAPSADLQRRRLRPARPWARGCGPGGGQVGAAAAAAGECGSRSPGPGPGAAKRRAPRGVEPAPPAPAAALSAHRQPRRKGSPARAPWDRCPTTAPLSPPSSARPCRPASPHWANPGREPGGRTATVWGRSSVLRVRNWAQRSRTRPQSRAQPRALWGRGEKQLPAQAGGRTLRARWGPPGSASPASLRPPRSWPRPPPASRASPDLWPLLVRTRPPFLCRLGCPRAPCLPAGPGVHVCVQFPVCVCGGTLEPQPGRWPWWPPSPGLRCKREAAGNFAPASGRALSSACPSGRWRRCGSGGRASCAQAWRGAWVPHRPQEPGAEAGTGPGSAAPLPRVLGEDTHREQVRQAQAPLEPAAGPAPGNPPSRAPLAGSLPPTIPNKAAQAGPERRLPARRGAQESLRSLMSGTLLHADGGVPGDPTPLLASEAGAAAVPAWTLPSRPPPSRGQGLGLRGEVKVTRPGGACSHVLGREGRPGQWV